jgi:GSH-dependent disulfide-bond oxidoreductase
MIDLYTWTTPNGRKASIMLEECELPYRVTTVNIGAGEQFKPSFLAINPNNRIPAIVDPEGPDGKPLPLFESGAILIYLSEKTGGKFMPKVPRTRYIALQWLMFQMGGVGPMFGQAHHFIRAKKDEIPYATERYVTESKRLYGVLEKRLSEADYLADEYSIADIATYPWVARHEWHRVDLAAFPAVKRWYDRVGGRPAVVRGMAVPSA